MSKQKQGFTPDPPEMPVMPRVDELGNRRVDSHAINPVDSTKPPTHFHGIRRGDGCHLYKSNDEYQIEISPDRSQQVYNHSPDGFEWGYSGSGPSQLALAIMLEVTSDEHLALRLYHDFKFDVVSGMADDQWTIPVANIVGWIDAHGEEHDDIPY